MNVSRRENIWCRAETYFAEIKKLVVGEIYVSEVIGAYVKGHMINICDNGSINKVLVQAR